MEHVDHRLTNIYRFVTTNILPFLQSEYFTLLYAYVRYSPIQPLPIQKSTSVFNGSCFAGSVCCTGSDSVCCFGSSGSTLGVSSGDNSGLLYCSIRVLSPVSELESNVEKSETYYEVLRSSTYDFTDLLTFLVYLECWHLRCYESRTYECGSEDKLTTRTLLFADISWCSSTSTL
jgi:hypothetical protein